MLTNYAYMALINTEKGNTEKVKEYQSKYNEIVKQMKSVVNNYKSAEGSEKQQYVDELRNLTLQKKEIKALINPSIEDEDEN